MSKISPNAAKPVASRPAPRYTVDLGQTVGATGWQGSGAAFTTAWHRDAVGAKALAALTSSTAAVVDWTAVNVSQLESALEQAADQAESHGMPIGSDGQPPLIAARSSLAG